MIMNPASLPLGVVCLAAGISQFIVIQKAKELGYAVLAVDHNPNAPGFALSDEQLVMSTYEAKPIIDRLHVLQDKYRLVGVINRSSGLPVVTAAEICQAFMLPGTSPNSAAIVTDKSRLMKACKEYGIAAPVCQSVSSLSEIDRSCLHFPCVVKPALTLVGKSGVRVVSDSDELPAAFGAACSAGMNGIVNIEEHVPGRDLSLLAVVIENRLHSIMLRDELNVVTEAGNIRFNGIAMPSVFSGQAEEACVLELAQQVVDRFGLDRTAINMSCRCEPGGTPKLIEIHLDLGGDMFFEGLVPKSTSEDVLKIMIRAVTGDLSELPYIEFNPAALIFGEGEGLESERSYNTLTASNRPLLELAISRAGSNSDVF